MNKGEKQIAFRASPLAVMSFQQQSAMDLSVARLDRWCGHTAFSSSITIILLYSMFRGFNKICLIDIKAASLHIDSTILLSLIVAIY